MGISLVDDAVEISYLYNVCLRKCTGFFIYEKKKKNDMSKQNVRLNMIIIFFNIFLMKDTI